MKKLLAMMVGMFHEHLYGCSGAPGARILSNDFPMLADPSTTSMNHLIFRSY